MLPKSDRSSLKVKIRNIKQNYSLKKKEKEVQNGNEIGTHPSHGSFGVQLICLKPKLKAAFQQYIYTHLHL